MFDFYVVSYQDLCFRELSDPDTKGKIELWQSLIHVCRRWRTIVLGSPRPLNLQLFCIPGSSAKKALDVWPSFPLLTLSGVSERSVTNVIPVLGVEHRRRIRQINLQINLNFYTSYDVENLWRAMEVPFQELEGLYLGGRLYMPGLSDSFLGRSAPRLRHFCLRGIQFPGLPKLLLSATHLVDLHLHDICDPTYILPYAMANCLAVLTSLETLHIEFECDNWRPFFFLPRQPLSSPVSPPPARSILPALTFFSFKGETEYLDDLVPWIDCPRLYRLSMAFFDGIWTAPEIDQFISRTPTLGAYDEARFIFESRKALVRLRQSHPQVDHGMLEVEILSGGEFSSLLKICTSSSHLLLAVEKLYIDGYPSSSL